MVVATTMSASAQQATATHTLTTAKMDKMTRVAVAPTAQQAVKNAKPHKSAANGVLYNRPEGAYFYGWNKEGNGYGASILVVAPYSDIIFENKSTASGAPQWSLVGSKQTYDVTDDADEAGNLHYGFLGSWDPETDKSQGISTYLMPTLTIGQTSFTLGTEGKHSSFSSYGSGMLVYEEAPLVLVDGHTGGYGFGSLDTHYLYGTGSITTSTGAVRHAFGVLQEFDKPMSPLSVSEFYANYYSTQALPIPAGKEIYLTVYELLENGDLGEEMATLTATSTDIFDVEDVTTSIKNGLGYDGSWYSGSISFTSKSTDAFGAETIQPVIIDKRFAIVISGIDQEGVSIGFTSSSLTDGANAETAYFLVEEEGTGDRYQHYYTDEALNITLLGTYDRIYTPYATTFTAPTEGGVATTTDDEGEAMDVAYMYTALPWVDADSNENYFVDVEYTKGDPEWLQVAVDDSHWNETDKNGEKYNVVLSQFTADALPAGVTGRSAKVYVYGIADTAVFTVNQGDVEDGIATVTTTKNTSNAATYNLAGQKVGKNFKGIVIKNGVKRIQK